MGERSRLFRKKIRKYLIKIPDTNPAITSAITIRIWMHLSSDKSDSLLILVSLLVAGESNRDSVSDLLS